MNRLIPPLREGAVVHVFRSGGGLRVASLRRGGRELGYGESINFEPALDICGEDYEAGCRPYKEVYGPIHTHYLTGSTKHSSKGDAWVCRGADLDIHWVDGLVEAVVTSSREAGPRWDVLEAVV